MQQKQPFRLSECGNNESLTQGRELLLESPLCWPDYELLDSGEFEKLERFGDYILCRPEPKALWSKSLSQREWDSAVNMKFVPGAGFGKAGKEDSGSWKMVRKMPEQWRIRYRKSLPGAAKPLDLTLRLGLTSFKHVGVFPEQAPNWDFIYSQTSRLAERFKGGEAPKVLNLFAYTGAASLAAKAAGADYFTTTLTISPLKNAEKLNQIGEELAKKYQVAFLPSDFKKKNGYKRSTELSREYNLYRQDYCGCSFSKAERERQKEKANLNR